MKRRSQVFAVLCAAAAAMLIWAICQRLATRHVEKELADALRQKAALRAEIEKENSQIKRLAVAADRLHRAAPKKSDLTAAEVSAMLQRRAKDRANFALYFHSFILALGLSPEKIARFEDLLADRSAALRDIAEAAQAQGLKPKDPSLNSLRKEAAAQFGTQMIALVGAQNFQLFQDYGKTANADIIVSGLAGYAASTGSPISASQGLQLARILVSASATDFVTDSSIDWDSATAQAQQVLSAQQVVALRNKAAMVTSWTKLQGAEASLAPAP